jgi:hypothetical protein
MLRDAPANQALQQTGAALRLFEVQCLAAAPAAEPYRSAVESHPVSMPGFHYRLVCHACVVRSPLYSLYAADMRDPRIGLPGWSRAGRCFLHIVAVMQEDEFARIQSDRAAQRDLASKLSSPQAVIGFPEWRGKEVVVVPEPLCPFCGGAIEVVAFAKAEESDESWQEQECRRAAAEPSAPADGGRDPGSS